jgi:UDP-N-acetylmuramyl tripeptide synthase
LAGIAGTHGKTVTSHLLASILRRSELEVGVISSLSAVSPLVPSSDDATPAAPQLADCAAAMTLAGQSHAIVGLPRPDWRRVEWPEWGWMPPF